MFRPRSFDRVDRRRSAYVSHDNAIPAGMPLPERVGRGTAGLALACCILLGGALATPVRAEETRFSDQLIRVGVLNDRSGPYSDLSGEGSVIAARMAAEEFGNAVRGVPIEIISADHQNKPDVGAAIAGRWLDAEKVDVIADLSNSGVAFAVTGVAKQRNKIVLHGAASSDLTGKSCTPTSFQWVYNTYSNSHALANALSKKGYDSWFFVTVDYVYGHTLSADLRSAIAANSGKVVGEVRHPFNNADFSSFLLQAQASRAKVITIANAGADMINAIKQANEFSLTEAQAVVAPVVYITDIDALGLPVAQGLQFVTAFYWDRDDASRAWSQEFFKRHGRMPTIAQAGTYSAVRHYLRAVAAANSDDGMAAAAKMRAMPVSDAFASHGVVRADGQFVHDMYLARVKKPSESRGRWDYYEILSTIPGDQAFRPLEKSECPLLKR
jgi:branched-chain amino acid transport system substrate-binding protein